MGTEGEGQKRRGGEVGEGRRIHTAIPRSLQTDGGRLKLLRCIQQRLPISGRPLDKGTGTAGIDECWAVVSAMEKMKAGANPDDRRKGEPETKADAGAEGDEAVKEEGRPLEEPAEEVEVIDEDAVRQEDPVLAKAKDLAEGELAHVSIHRAEDSFKRDLPRILPFHRAAVVLEAPTSKAKVPPSPSVDDPSPRHPTWSWCPLDGAVINGIWVLNSKRGSLMSRAARLGPS